MAIFEYCANLIDVGLWYLHRIGLLGAAAGCIAKLSLAEYGKVIIFIQVLKSLNTCSRSKTENINLEPSLTHTFLGFSTCLSFPMSSVEFSPWYLSSIKGVGHLNSRHFAGTFPILYHYFSLQTCMLDIIIILILLKKKLWLRVRNNACWLPTKISDSSFHSVKSSRWKLPRLQFYFPASCASRHDHMTSFHPLKVRMELLRSK